MPSGVLQQKQRFNKITHWHVAEKCDASTHFTTTVVVVCGYFEIAVSTPGERGFCL